MKSLRRSVLWLAPPFALLSILLVLLEVLVREGLLSSYLCPPPSQIASAFAEFAPDLGKAFAATGFATLQGFLLSAVIAAVLCLGLSLSQVLRRAVFPVAVFFQTVPIIAIAPLLVIWFGFGLPTVRASALIVSFFPILSNGLVGLDSARRESTELLRSLGATPLQILMKLQIPSAVRASFAGLRVAAGLAVVGALVGEFVGGGGLGSLIDSARTQQRVDLVFACVILAALMGLVFLSFVLLLEFLVQRWRPFNE